MATSSNRSPKQYKSIISPITQSSLFLAKQSQSNSQSQSQNHSKSHSQIFGIKFKNPSNTLTLYKQHLYSLFLLLFANGQPQHKNILNKQIDLCVQSIQKVKREHSCLCMSRNFQREQAGCLVEKKSQIQIKALKIAKQEINRKAGAGVGFYKNKNQIFHGIKTRQLLRLAFKTLVCFIDKKLLKPYMNLFDFARLAGKIIGVQCQVKQFFSFQIIQYKCPQFTKNQVQVFIQIDKKSFTYRYIKQNQDRRLLNPNLDSTQLLINNIQLNNNQQISLQSHQDSCFYNMVKFIKKSSEFQVLQELESFLECQYQGEEIQNSQIAVQDFIDVSEENLGEILMKEKQRKRQKQQQEKKLKQEQILMNFSSIKSVTKKSKYALTEITQNISYGGLSGDNISSMFKNFEQPSTLPSPATSKVTNPSPIVSPLSSPRYPPLPKNQQQSPNKLIKFNKIQKSNQNLNTQIRSVSDSNSNSNINSQSSSNHSNNDNKNEQNIKINYNTNVNKNNGDINLQQRYKMYQEEQNLQKQIKQLSEIINDSCYQKLQICQSVYMDQHTQQKEKLNTKLNSKQKQMKKSNHSNNSNNSNKSGKQIGLRNLSSLIDKSSKNKISVKFLIDQLKQLDQFIQLVSQQNLLDDHCSKNQQKLQQIQQRKSQQNFPLVQILQNSLKSGKHKQVSKFISSAKRKISEIVVSWDQNQKGLKLKMTQSYYCPQNQTQLKTQPSIKNNLMSPKIVRPSTINNNANSIDKIFVPVRIRRVQSKDKMQQCPTSTQQSQNNSSNLNSKGSHISYTNSVFGQQSRIKSPVYSKQKLINESPLSKTQNVNKNHNQQQQKWIPWPNEQQQQNQCQIKSNGVFKLVYYPTI